MLDRPSQSGADRETEIYRVYREARSARSSFFEKLAILDGGTVALVITAVLGPMQGAVRHKFIVGAGLSCLVLAMLTLLTRNFLAAQFEFDAAEAQARSLTGKRMGRFAKAIHWVGLGAMILSASGLLLLLLEVWLILV